jgi:hypothetical protein
VDATAFSVRDEHFHCIVVSSWDAGDAPDAHVQWARDFWRAMRAWSAGRVYMNILGQDEEDRVREAFGPAYARLQAVKAKYDAANAFAVNHNIRPLHGA